jgi:hypothetical protein
MCNPEIEGRSALLLFKYKKHPSGTKMSRLVASKMSIFNKPTSPNGPKIARLASFGMPPTKCRYKYNQ